jgi:alpha-tubulin suppressor-like RCC1 family protein
MPNNVVQVAAGMGAAHTLALLSDGSVLAGGRGHDGEKGDGTRTNVRTTPAPATDLRCVPTARWGRGA